MCSFICQLKSEFTGPCLQQFNGVFSKFVKQEERRNVAHTNSAQGNTSCAKNYASPLVLSQETTMNVLFQIKSAQSMEVQGV